MFKTYAYMLLLFLPLATFAADNAPEKSAQVDIREWKVPWANSRPRDPYVAPDGHVWFVGQMDDYAAALNPETGRFRRIDLAEGTGPHNLIVDDGGTVWYAGNRAAHIGRLDPETSKIHKIPTPEPKAADPHTMMFDGKGRIWFTAQFGNHVGRLTMKSERVETVAVPTANARPYGLVVDKTGRPWIALLGTHKLATVEPASMKLEEIALPREDARPRRLALTGDGRVWYVDYAEGYLGVYDPETGDIEEWRTPRQEKSFPYAMASDRAGRVWFVETAVEPNRLVGFDAETEKFFSITEIPSGAGSVRHMVYDPDRNAIWFGTDANTIGRASLPE